MELCQQGQGSGNREVDGSGTAERVSLPTVDEDVNLEMILELTGEVNAVDVRQLTLRGRGLHTFEPLAPMLPALDGLSLSHNRLTSLAGMEALQRLATLNVNHNALTSLHGLQHCTLLRELYAAGNRLRSLEPLAGLRGLRTLNVMGNELCALGPCVEVRWADARVD
jgi:Leucine-rich repeat (LRR) protein